MSVKYYKINGVWNTYSYWHYHYGYTTVPSNAVGFKSCAYATFGQDVDPGYYIEGSLPGFLNWSMWAANSEYAWYNTQMMAVQNHRYPSVAESIEMTDGTVTSPAAMYDDNGSIYYLIRDDMADGWLTEEEATERGWSIEDTSFQARYGVFGIDYRSTDLLPFDEAEFEIMQSTGVQQTYGEFVDDAALDWMMSQNQIMRVMVPIEMPNSLIVVDETSGNILLQNGSEYLTNPWSYKLFESDEYIVVQPLPLPTVSLTDDFGTYGSLDLAKYNWLCPDGVTVDTNSNTLVPIAMSPMLAKNGLGSYRGSSNEYLIETTPHSYDATKSYAVIEWQTTMGTTAGRAELMIINLDGNIGIMSISAVDISVTHARVAVCSDPSAENVTVQDANGVFYNAFKYTDENSNVYYYVLDGTQTDWTDDLSALGYTETPYYTELDLYVPNEKVYPQTSVVKTSINVTESYLKQLYTDSDRTIKFKYDPSYTYERGWYYNGVWNHSISDISEMPATTTSGNDYAEATLVHTSGRMWSITNKTSANWYNTYTNAVKFRAHPKRMQYFAFYPTNQSASGNTSFASNQTSPLYSCYPNTSSSPQIYSSVMWDNLVLAIDKILASSGYLSPYPSSFNFTQTDNNLYLYHSGITQAVQSVIFHFETNATKYIHVAMLSVSADVQALTGTQYDVYDIAGNQLKYESNVRYTAVALWKFDGSSATASNPSASLVVNSNYPTRLAFRQGSGSTISLCYIWYIKTYSSGPVLPTVSLSGDFETNNWLYRSSDASVGSISAGGTQVLWGLTGSQMAQVSYDSTKSYAVLKWYSGTGGSDVGENGALSIVSSSNYIAAKNDTSSSVNLYALRCAVCSSNLATVVHVWDSSNVAYNAFKYTADGTDYYYVLDDTHVEWTDDLESIGYSLPPTLELVLGLIAGGNLQPVTFGANDYWYASLLSNEDKDKYIAMGGQIISQGTYGLLKYSSDFRYELLALYAGNGENPVSFDQSNFYINGTGGGYPGAVIIHSRAAFSTQVQTWKCLVQKQ